MDFVGAQIHTPSLWAIPQTPPSQKAQSPLKHSVVLDSQEVMRPPGTQGTPAIEASPGRHGSDKVPPTSGTPHSMSNT